MTGVDGLDFGSYLPDGPDLDPDGQVHVHKYVEHRDGLIGGEPAYYAVCRGCGAPTGRYVGRLPDSMVVARAE